MNTGEIILYQNQEGNIKIDVRLEDETVWLSQAQLCDLFQKSKATISEHIKNVFEEGELDEKLVVRKFRTTTQHGAITGKTQTVEVNGYNLDVIISVGYRVKSPQGTQFRIWATQRLKEYIIKGFAGRAIFSVCRNHSTAANTHVYTGLDNPARQYFATQ
jgi:hypothetical protein